MAASADMLTGKVQRMPGVTRRRTIGPYCEHGSRSIGMNCVSRSRFIRSCSWLATLPRCYVDRRTCCNIELDSARSERFDVAMGASTLQSCARITIGPRRRNSYFVCGFTGYIVGLVLVMVLCVRAELGMAARLAVAIAPPAVFLILLRL